MNLFPQATGTNILREPNVTQPEKISKRDNAMVSPILDPLCFRMTVLLLPAHPCYYVLANSLSWALWRAC